VYENLLGAIGNTPVVRLNKVVEGIKATVLVKLEYFNPGGSVKDRMAVAIVEDAERTGELKPGGTIIEATSGNTGIGLALVAAVKGYTVRLVIPDKVSKERLSLLKALGAEVILTAAGAKRDSRESHINVAKRLAEATSNSFLSNQYYNKMNPEAHYRTTGREIWEQTRGKIDVFVAGIGTGGTITGVSKYLKERKPDVKIIGVEPEGSIISGGEEKPFELEGIGYNFVPGTLSMSLLDEMMKVSDRDAFLMARRLAREEGILVGGSSGAAVFAALDVARKLESGKTVLALLPDTGRNYLSKIFSDEWMREKFLE
jgi:cystathionine beta-synthase